MELPEELQERIDIIKHKLKFFEQKPTVAAITQLHPFQLAGAEINQLLILAGGLPITGELQEQNPDVIVLMPEGRTIEQTMRNLGDLLQIPGFTELRAVKNNRLYLADALTYFKNTEENQVDSIELLAEIIYPKQFIFGHEGEGWVKFEV